MYPESPVVNEDMCTRFQLFAYMYCVENVIIETNVMHMRVRLGTISCNAIVGF